MKILRQLVIILAFSFLGEILSKGLNLPIPGSVIGLVLLFIALLSGIVKPKDIDVVADFLIDNLAFFFIPAAVGLIVTFYLIKDIWISIFLITCITTVLVMVVTGRTVQFVRKRRDK